MFPKNCITEDKACSDFPVPDNGGVVCSHTIKTNTKRCQVKCNYGYEHPDRRNLYELCGPDSNWRWTHETNNTGIIPCIGK